MSRIWTHSLFDAAALAALPAQTEVIAGGKPLSEEWYDMAAACAALIVGGQTIFDTPVLARIGPGLRALARTGIGYDAINVDAATAHGVMVINTPDGPTESTAEHAVALILNLAKGVMVSDRAMRLRQGYPRYGVLEPGLELRGATLGLVGLGRIGGRVAEIARVLGMQVLAFDPYTTPERAQQLGVTLTSTLAELLGAAHVVSIHCPAMPATYRLINAETLAMMRPGSYFVNVARGAIVEEAALLDALRSGHLAGAGLDVYEQEPTIADHPLYSLPNTICTPHVASYTTACVLRMQIQACEQVAMALRGERPTHLVNPEVWKR